VYRNGNVGGFKQEGRELAAYAKNCALMDGIMMAITFPDKIKALGLTSDL
jgi:hypothetical protein